MGANQGIWSPHVTVAAVIAGRDGRFLMVEEEIHGALRYNQPAGHLEPDETLADAARRETREETGWDVELDHFLGVHQWFSPVHHDHVIRFGFSAHTLAHHPEYGLDAGIRRALWLTRDEVAALGEKLRSPFVLTCIDDWLGGMRLPLSTIRSMLRGPRPGLHA